MSSKAKQQNSRSGIRKAAVTQVGSVFGEAIFAAWHKELVCGLVDLGCLSDAYLAKSLGSGTYTVRSKKSLS